MYSIILHPEILRLQERIQELRNELYAAFDERLRLTFEVFPQLRDRYAELFSDLEQIIQQRTLEMSERRRMVELFSLKLDRGQKLDTKTVELVMKAVRTEYARVRNRMHASFNERRRKEMDDSWRPSPVINPQSDGASTTSPRRRADEIRDLYRVLAKRLHPDTSSAVGERRRHYWDLVQRGYLRNDLPLLRTLAHLIDTVDVGNDGRGGELRVEAQRLEGALRTERARLESLKQEEIFRMRKGLDNEIWIRRRRDELEAEIDAIESDIAKCDRFLAPIISGQKAPPPEIVQSIWSSFVEDMYLNHR